MVTQATTAQLTSLTERERAILEHVYRYRMTTREVLYRQFFEPKGLQLDAMTSVLRRIAASHDLNLADAERRKLSEPYFLRPQRLFRKEIYYHLTLRGARTVAIHSELPPRALEKFDRPLGVDPLTRSYATLSFCCLNGTSRQRITYHEFRARLPHYVVRGCRSDAYYFDLATTPPRLGFVRIDFGRGDPEDYVHKCYNDVLKHYQHAPMRERIDQCLFVVTLLTPNDHRRELLLALRDKHEDPVFAKHIEVAAVSELQKIPNTRRQTK